MCCFLIWDIISAWNSPVCLVWMCSSWENDTLLLSLSCPYRGRCISPSLWHRCRGRGRCPAPRTCSRWRRSVRRRSSRWSGWCRPPPPAGPGSVGSCSGAAPSWWCDPSTNGSPRRISAGSPGATRVSKQCGSALNMFQARRRGSQSAERK